MNQTGYTSKGPQCFGNSKRTSFVDIRDDDIPGPGTHDSRRIDRNTPTKWKFGKSTERDSFLEKYPRPNPSPFTYQPKINLCQTLHPSFSIPKSEQEKPAEYKQDENCRVDYEPKSNFPKYQSPKYSFGYFFQRDYSTAVPPPNNYEVKDDIKNKQFFNKTQSYFTKSDRPLPYGQEGKFPGTGKYQINYNDPMDATAHKFGSSEKLPDSKFEGVVPIKFYDIAGQIKQPGKGFTMRPFYEGVKNKDVQVFPAPNHYNPKFLQQTKKIVTFTSQRSQLYNKDHIKYPSPQKHVTSSDFYKKQRSLSFTKHTRYTPNETIGPGPSKYNNQKKFSQEKGYMGRKLKKIPDFITPAGSNYEPVDVLTKPNPQRVITFDANRTDFSKSITKNVGPGDYIKDKDSQGELGKMSKSQKFPKNRNKNPGPGYYEIGTTIGQLPKYYCGQKKLTTTGYSTFAVNMTQRAKQHSQWVKQQQTKSPRQQREQQSNSQQKK